jgi:hypothetical protein
MSKDRSPFRLADFSPLSDLSSVASLFFSLSSVFVFSPPISNNSCKLNFFDLQRLLGGHEVRSSGGERLVPT